MLQDICSKSSSSKKIPFQVVDDHIDSPVGSIPNLAVVCSPRCGDTDMHMGLFKVRDVIC